MSKSEIGQLVGRRLREVRQQAGLTQPELGDRAAMAAAEETYDRPAESIDEWEAANPAAAEQGH